MTLLHEQHYAHETVLLQEAVDALITNPEGHYIDGTFGRGGHARRILAHLGQQGRLTAFDRDPAAQAAAHPLLADTRFCFVHSAFSALAQQPAGSADGVLLDLGISSPQIDNPARGFSFRHDGPLDMRMDPTHGESASQWLAQASETEIARVIKEYGEERFAKAIAKLLVQARKTQPIERTHTLAQLVAQVVKTRDGAQHPATRTFQAMRIFVNAELEQLQLALQACLKVLKAGGRLVVISFHSLEDRIVKQFIATHSREQIDRQDPLCMLARNSDSVMPLRSLARVMPSAAEIARNPRSRSAVMRIAQRTSAPLNSGAHA